MRQVIHISIMSSRTSRSAGAASPADPLLAAAVALVEAEGSDALTMDRLAERAGVSRATLYRHFGSREALLGKVAEAQGRDPAELLEPDVRTRILQAARAVLGRIGLGATVEQIAVEAEVGPATVYRHFGSREGLIGAFFASLPPRRRVAAMAAEPGDDPRAALVRLGAEALRFIGDNRDLFRLSLMNPEAAVELRALRSRDDRMLLMLGRYFATQIESGRLRPADPQRLAAAYFGMLFMFGLLAPLQYPHLAGDPDELAAFVADLFLHGATASEDARERPRAPRTSRTPRTSRRS